MQIAGRYKNNQNGKGLECTIITKAKKNNDKRKGSNNKILFQNTKQLFVLIS